MAFQPGAELASRIVWFDAFTSNLDRTPRNTNMLVWHGKLWLIDHGAALYFHHDWRDFMARATSPFAPIKDHVLLRFASRLAEADASMSQKLTPSLIASVVALIPDTWLEDEPSFASKALHREAYVRYLTRRLEAPRTFFEEAVRARSLHL